MENDIISNIFEIVKTKDDMEDYIDGKKISKKNFKLISDERIQNKIVFIDGGNQIILSSSDFCLQFIRVAYCIYKDSKILDNKKEEFYILTSTQNINDKISFRSKIFNNALNINTKDLQIDVEEITKIGEIARRFAEINIAKSSIDKLDVGDLLILDGELESKEKYEDRYLDSLIKKAEAKKVFFAGLCKTTTTLTKNGISVNAKLGKLGPIDSWYYPSTKKNNIFTHFIKLHSKSKYVFKFQIATVDEKKAFVLLKNNSKDPLFIGYPYGLIEADKLARISNQETNYLKTKFYTKMGKKIELINGHENAINAHEILDNI